MEGQGRLPLTFPTPRLSNWQPLDTTGCQDGKKTTPGGGTPVAFQAAGTMWQQIHSTSSGGQRPC